MRPAPASSAASGARRGGRRAARPRPARSRALGFGSGSARPGRSRAVSDLLPRTRCFWRSVSEAEASTSKIASTRVSDFWACCPPGPLERENRSAISESGIVTERVTRIDSRSMPAILLDVDGVFHVSGRPIDGVADAVRRLPRTAIACGSSPTTRRARGPTSPRTSAPSGSSSTTRSSRRLRARPPAYWPASACSP